MPEMRTIHHLKTVQPYYDESESGIKTFEIRRNDRKFYVGDILHLYEWDGLKATGREHYKEVIYLLRDQPYVPAGYVCMGVLPCDPNGLPRMDELQKALLKRALKDRDAVQIKRAQAIDLLAAIQENATYITKENGHVTFTGYLTAAQWKALLNIHKE